MKKFLFAFIFQTLFFPAFAGGKEFRLGVISDKPVGRINQYGPLARYVAQRLEPFGITSGKMVIARDTDAMAAKLRRKEVDVVFESAFPTIELRDETGVVPRLLVWKKGSRQYTSVIFVRKESPIRNLHDLRGKTIVFEDRKSTSAYLLPKAELQRSGLTVLPLDDEQKPTDALRFVFAGEEANQAFFVLKKRADAGAFSSEDWRDLPQKEKDELRIIHETKPVLRYVAAFSPALPAELSEAVAAILVGMEGDPAGRKILQEAEIARIEKLSEEDLQSLQEIRELMRFLRE